MDKRIIILIILFALNFNSRAQEVIKILDTGNEPSNMKTFIFIPEDSTYLKSNIKGTIICALEEYCFTQIKYYILEKELKRDKKCTDINGPYGSIGIKIYTDEASCYKITDIKESIDFLYSLALFTKIDCANDILIDPIFKIIIREIGEEEFKKYYAKIW